jgi:hypothetical protein
MADIRRYAALMDSAKRLRARISRRAKPLDPATTQRVASLFAARRMTVIERLVAADAKRPPSPHVPRSVHELRDQPLWRGKEYFEPPEQYFCGIWADRHPLNVPGPFYGAMTDTCCDGPPLAPASLLYDADGQGFVWRQPRNADETLALMTGASSDPFLGYACDGDQHWTPETVRGWWQTIHLQQPEVDRLVAVVQGERPELATPFDDLVFRCLPVGGNDAEERARMRRIVAEYVRYRDTEMPADLRRYIFFLENGRTADDGDELPQL